MIEITKVPTVRWTTINAIDSSLGKSPEDLFIGAVRGPVIMSECPPNYPVYTEYTVTRVLQLFHIFNYIMPSLFQSDMCHPQLRPSSDDVVWTFGSESPSYTGYGIQHRPLPAWVLMASAPVVLSSCETRFGP
jgi:hypothetical protein